MKIKETIDQLAVFMAVIGGLYAFPIYVITILSLTIITPSCTTTEETQDGEALFLE